MKDKKYVFELVIRESENLEKICSIITACDYSFEELKERKVDNEILFCKDILVDHLPKKELEKYFKHSKTPSKVSSKEDEGIIEKISEGDHMKWQKLKEDISNPNIEYYPKNYAENNCMYYLEFFQNDRWKLYLRQILSVPKFGICNELHPYVLGEGKIDKPEMISMYTYKNLKRIVDGLNLLPKLNEDLNPYPKMSSGTYHPPQATTDYFEKYKKENNS